MHKCTWTHGPQCMFVNSLKYNVNHTWNYPTKVCSKVYLNLLNDSYWFCMLWLRSNRDDYGCFFAEGRLSTSIWTGEIFSWQNSQWLYWDQDIPCVHFDNQLYVLFNDQEAMLINLEIPLWIIYHQLHKVSQTVHFSDILTCYWDILGNVHSFFIQTSILFSVPAGVHRPTPALPSHMQAS